jgi:hypothetical protein
MKTMTPCLIALMVGLAFASGLPAQDLKTRQLAPTDTRVLSCGQVNMAWNVALITQYPRIPEACFEVITNNDIKWARFEAADFYGPSGAKMGRYTVLSDPGD